MGLLSAGLAFAQDKPAEKTREKVDDTRAVLDKWVEARRTISQDKRKWALERETLTDRIDVLKREIASLRARIDATQGNITETDAKKAELVDETAALEAAARAMATTVVALEARTRELLPRLPEPIREKVQPLSQRIPEDPADSKSSLGERFANVIGILQEIDKFNREITVVNEVRTLGDGTTAEVSALYLGIGKGYYVTAKGNAAGIGTATAEGWVWTPADDAAAAIARAIAILRNEQPAAFVRLPIRIQ